MESKYNYFKRDISWLSFNYRVLMEALDEHLPLYERINFISIYSSNLEEFYKIRVADHKAVASGATESDEETVQSARELVEEINREVNRQLDDRVLIYEQKKLPALRKNHIIIYQDRPGDPFHHQFVKDFFKEEIAVAEMSMSKRAEFLTKYCNIKQNSSVAWLDYVVVDGAGIHAKLEDFKDSYAVGGIDLSQTTDLTAASVVIERDGVLYAFAQFFMPANRLETAQAIDGVPYDIFVKQGIVKLSGENHVDYRDVYEWFSMLRDQYGIYILKIGYDRYSAQYLIDDLKNAGWQTDDVWQGENLAPVIREFEGVIKDGNFKIADNNLLKAHFLNVALKHNMETRKFRPVKIEQRARIDGFVSVIDALTVRQKYYNEIGEMLKNAG